uniref:Uncharacterized protein n=1 Tax=viral metagenome TaxID=1070528 RepID=A0A6H1ZCS5_9ZZZZ
MGMVGRPPEMEDVFPGYGQKRREGVSEVLQEALMMLVAPGAAGLRMIKKSPFAPVGGLAKAAALENTRRTLPSSLRKFLVDEESAERLSNLGEMKRLKINVAPVTGRVEEFYRPAVRTKEGKILWHPKARMHSEAISLNLGGKKKFDYSSVAGSGGIGPDGSYYESDFLGDALEELWHQGVEDTSKGWRP